MDQIDECFTKFFFAQALEIEPSTIQCLIDHGYCSKVSLIAMDLVLDLPEIKEINLAQRSILRKYLAALQERSPFILDVDEATYVNNNHANANLTKEHAKSKKRKLEVFQEEEGSDQYEDVEEQSPFASRSRRQTRPKSFTPSPVSPVVNTRLSFVETNNKTISPTESDDYEMAEQIDETMVQFPTAASKRRAASRVSKKKEVVRTPSQIRYQELKKERETLANLSQLDQSISSVSGSRRSSIGRTPHVTKSTVKSRLEERLVQQNDNSPIEERMEVAQPQQKHVPTAAELAIRAKIEQKKNSGDKPKRRGTARSRK